MLKPLEQWYCDVCGEVINKAEDGYVIWNSRGKAHNFQVIHQGKCDDNELPSSAALTDFLGPDGLTYLMTFLSLGPIAKNLGHRSHREVDDLNEFVDLVRRFQVPYYEEARRKFSDPDLLDRMSDANEVYPYRTEVLERISKS